MTLAVLRKLSDRLFGDARPGDYIDTYRYWCEEYHKHFFALLVARARGHRYSSQESILAIKQHVDFVLSCVERGEDLRLAVSSLKRNVSAEVRFVVEGLGHEQFEWTLPT